MARHRRSPDDAITDYGGTTPGAPVEIDASEVSVRLEERFRGKPLSSSDSLGLRRLEVLFVEASPAMLTRFVAARSLSGMQKRSTCSSTITRHGSPFLFKSRHCEQ